MPQLDIFFYPFSFILGLVFGSFYNVVGLRIPKKQSILTPPSHCPHCNRQLNAIDLLPVFGYLIRRGKCASCGERIASLYIFVELITGCLFLLSYHQSKGDLLALSLALLFVSLCVIVSVSDIAYMIIPNKVLLFFLPLLALLRLATQPDNLISYTIGGTAGFGLLFLVAVIKPGAMGMGDVKLFGLLGFVIGWQNVLVSLFIASLAGLVAGVNLMLRGKATLKAAIPFGPFLCIGSVVAYFWGSDLLQGYLSLFF